MKLLNLGCGSRYFSDWTNVDFVSSSQDVIAHNLLEGIPFPEHSFEVAYHSHVLEHFPKDKALFFMKECYRVLKPNGILRIAVPDLEQIARIYIQQLEKVLAEPSPLNEANYEWSVIELYDQTVRQKSGGEMAKIWKKSELINGDWIESRSGSEFMNFRESLKKSTLGSSLSGTSNLRKYFRFATYRNKLISWLLADSRFTEYLALGRFRLSGEVHQWMYDRHSLSNLLKSVGFNSVSQVDATSSMIADWKKYQWLDVEHDRVRKPDSIFLEGRK